MEKTQWFNGIHFTRDEQTGYYLNSTIRKRMHRYVWEYHNGEIPSGYEIRHIDHNPANNAIENGTRNITKTLKKSYTVKERLFANNVKKNTKAKRQEETGFARINVKVNGVEKAG